MIYHDDVEMRLECDELGMVKLTNKRSGAVMRATIAGRDIVIGMASNGTRMMMPHSDVCAIEKPKATLGAVTGALLRIVNGYASDEISQATGIWPSPFPALERTAREHGWSVQEVLDEIARRGVSEKWQYVNGIAWLEHCRQAGH